ncbi:DUF4179 domain-containing protein [Bacillus massiliigorillae]|uniref:DUF4179 domain-containing protein n=1 Tax=Bacillus massiliigorillae TaxID=1243664 RepID=UPI0003A5A4F9|nr:DUF4179 domain-containing protein [Bacillus massiliigorillae]
MNKEFTQFKKEIDQMYVPIEKLDQIIADTIMKNDSKQIKQKKNYLKRGLGAALVACSLAIGSAYVSPTMAKVVSHIPLIGHYFNADDKGLKMIAEHDMAMKIDKTVKKHGTTFTVHDAYYDGTRLVIGYTRKSILPSENFKFDLMINGKEMGDLRFSQSERGYYVNPNQYIGLIEVKPVMEKFPEALNLKLIFSKYTEQTDGWDFSFSIKQSDDLALVKPKDRKAHQIAGAEVTLQSLSYGLGGTELTFERLQDSAFLNKHMDFYIYYQLLNDRGELIKSLGGVGMGDEPIDGKERIIDKHSFEPLPKYTKKVTIIPYTIPSNNGVELPKIVMPIVNQTIPFTIEQGEIGAISVTKLEKNKENLSVYFSVNSDFQFDDTLTHNGIWIENKDGKQLESSKGVQRVKGNQYKEVFQIKGNEELFIATYKYSKPIMYDPFTVTLP